MKWCALQCVCVYNYKLSCCQKSHKRRAHYLSLTASALSVQITVYGIVYTNYMNRDVRLLAKCHNFLVNLQ